MLSYIIHNVYNIIMYLYYVYTIDVNRTDFTDQNLSNVFHRSYRFSSGGLIASGV